MKKRDTFHPQPFSVPSLERINEPVICWLKAIAAQFIVLHHLALYGPLAHRADPLFGVVRLGLEQYALLAVQVFLVVGGFLAAAGMQRVQTWSGEQLLVRVWSRYIRLVFPLAFALVLAIFCSVLADYLQPHPATPVLVSVWDTVERFVRHVLLLHTLLGTESLSAGVWYVAIDFQLYVLLAIGSWVITRFGQQQAGIVDPDQRMSVLTGWVWMGVALSLFIFNPQPDWDAWAVYFLGSYGLGWLAFRGSRLQGLQRGFFGFGMLVLGLLALWFLFRTRVALALAVAMLLVVVVNRSPDMASRLRSTPSIIDFLSRTSYAVFLVHFPVSLVVNALWIRVFAPGPMGALLGVLACWMISIVVGAIFERWIERPTSHLLGRFA